MSTLIIVSHGSDRNPQARVPAAEHAKRIHESGRFKRVLVAYWKGHPHLSEILDEVKDSQVTIIPFFMADGYYTRIVIPRAMKLKGPVTRRAGQTIFYTLPVGTHPRVQEVVVQRAVDAGATSDDGLAILGHGTEKYRSSAILAEQMARRIRSEAAFKDAQAVFIDQEPNVRRVFELVQGDHIFMVPKFAADGWHVSETIPEDLQIENGTLERDGRKLTYTRAIGNHPLMAQVMLELAEQVW